MASPGPSERFVREITRCQNSVFAYILSLAPDPDTARDILQDTNVVLWQKAHEFEEGTEFMAWACTVARYEVLAHRRDHQRDRHIFGDALLATIAEQAVELPSEPDERARAFEDCLADLPPKQRALIAARYQPGASVKAMAQARGQSPAALSVSLSRIRKSLAGCVEGKLSKTSKS